MVDWSNVKCGDRVRIKGPTITGWIFPSGAPANIDQQTLNVVCIFFDSAASGATATSVHVAYTDSSGGIGIAVANPDDLELVADPVATLHDMRSAGPPAPSSCSCDIMSLMRAGCRCGYLAKEREASS